MLVALHVYAGGKASRPADMSGNTLKLVKMDRPTSCNALLTPLMEWICVRILGL